MTLQYNSAGCPGHFALVWDVPQTIYPQGTLYPWAECSPRTLYPRANRPLLKLTCSFHHSVMHVAHHDEFWGVDILQGGRSYPPTPVYHHFQIACTCCSLESQLILTDQITCFSQSLIQAIHDAEDDLEKIKLLAEEAREKLQQVGLLGTQRITLRQILIIASKYIHVLCEEERSMERSL